MISYPFVSLKKYASTWTAKAATFIRSNGTFNQDGFHSYCHTSASAYCWSYTFCLKEMLNWLCSQEETAEHCCPNPTVAAACKASVNSNECEVCEPTPEGNKRVVAPTIEPPEVSKETMMWLHRGLEEAAAEKCNLCTAIRKMGLEEPIWAAVNTIKVCEDALEECRGFCGLGAAASELDACKGWDGRCADAGC